MIVVLPDGGVPKLFLWLRYLTSWRRTMATKYGKTAQSKVKKVMHERKHGTLRSGSGKKVTSRKQAIAIGLSEARKAGAKVPKKK